MPNEILVVAGTFLVVSFVVGAIGFILFPKKGTSDAHARVDRSSKSEVAREEREQQLAIERQMRSTIGWLMRLTGAPPVDLTRRPPTGEAPGRGVQIVMVCTMIIVAVVVTWALIAGALQLLAWIEEPILKPALDPIFKLLFQVLMHPVGAALLGAAVIALGFPFADRFRRPPRFRTGVLLVALTFVTFWPLQFVAASFDPPFWEIKAALHGLGFFVSACLFTGGLESMRRANNAPEDDSWEFMR